MLSISIHEIMCGSSNWGKTNVLISLLESPHGIRARVLVVAKYRYLKNLLAPIEEIGYFTFSNNNDVASLNEALSNFIFVFDNDMRQARRDQRVLALGQHADCFYLYQTYAKIPIRDNANLFKQDDINLKHVYHDNVNPDISYENFCELCRCCWQQKSMDS